MQKIKELFRKDALVPTADIFPDINTDSLLNRLNPEKQGRESGKKELPATESSSLDSAELAIVDEVRMLRRKCQQHYQEHCDVYRQRLARVFEAKTEVESSASRAANDFASDRKEFESAVRGVESALFDCAKSRNRFRIRHRLERTAFRLDSGGVRWLALAMLFVLIESAMNSYLFAQKNEFGLLGGALAAALISIVNVGASSLAGYYSRFVNHRNLAGRFYGILILAVWLAFIFAFNFSVAHFRDGLVEGLLWNEAGTQAIQRIQSALFDVASIESWVLIAIGVLISVGALLKGFYADDPYPGYGNIERQLRRARDEYELKHSEILDQLALRRDDIIDELRDADEIVRQSVHESVDALYGQASLDLRFSEFLNQCDAVVQRLLRVYRDSNEACRTTPVPKYFRENYRLPETARAPASEGNGDAAKAESKVINDIVSKAVAGINAEYESAIKNFESARDVEQRAEAAVNEPS